MTRKLIGFLKIMLITFIILTSFFSSYAQSSGIEQDPKFTEFLNEKRRVNASINVNDRWKIQIFTGNNETSRKALNDFRREFRHVDATIIFQTPNYKVWAGNFRTRVEAERLLQEIKTRYPDAFLIKPSK
jgi:hypothetical protein